MSLWTEFVDPLGQDLRYGSRMLLSKPGFAVVALLSIALGIGATTAIFSVVYAVLIDPYPYRAADRIGQLVLTGKKDNSRGIGYSKAQYLDLKSRARSMEDAAAIDSSEVVMTGSGLAEVVRRGYCSPNFFDFFGVPPLFGRAFTARNAPQNTAPAPVAVLSYKFWQQLFQGRPEHTRPTAPLERYRLHRYWRLAGSLYLDGSGRICAYGHAAEHQRFHQRVLPHQAWREPKPDQRRVPAHPSGVP